MHNRYSSHPQSSVPRRRQRLALVVEHHSWLRLMLASLFEEIGFVVAAASNGYTGLRLAMALRPKVVVLGNALPELSSARVAAALRMLRDPLWYARHPDQRSSGYWLRRAPEDGSLQARLQFYRGSALGMHSGCPATWLPGPVAAQQHR
jgi:hypothetical protein